MAKKTQTAQDIIAALFQLAMTQPSHELDVFVSIFGHVKSVQVQVVENCSYKKGESHNRVLDVTLYQSNDTFTQELHTALSDVLALISQHNIKGVA